MKKHNFLLWMKETALFPYFYHGIIFYSTELFDCAVNFKFYLNIFIFLNINTNQTSKEQYLNQEAATYFGISRTKRFCRSSCPNVFSEKGVLKNFAKLTGRHLCWSLFLTNVAGFWPVTLLKKKLQHRCLPVNFANFLRTPFFKEHLRWLLFVLEIKCQACISTAVLSFTSGFGDFGHIFPICFMQNFS